MKEVECSQIGSRLGYIKDRTFAVTHLDGECVTARTYPRMLLIRPEITGDVMKITAPGMPDIIITISSLYDKTHATIVKTKVWRDYAECIDCGVEAGRWMSKFILEKEDGLRLVFYPSNDPKPDIQDRKYLFKQADDADTGTLHDETSYMLMNQGSFDDLNKRLEKPVTALQYRPNFLVKGPAAWEEDTWKWIKIGDSVIFKKNQPCMRCVLTNIDPNTGERNPDMQPLKTLKLFRVFPELDTSPYFGIHLGIRQIGRVKIGDDVFVGA